MAVPNVSYKVEVAWTSNWLTPAASRVWTDVSQFVELDQGMTIDYGRSDEVSTADTNTLTLTIDNTDGRFTWGNASSPYYPNVKIGKPIRVTATVGGVDYVRFTGLVDEWPVEWPGETAAFATAVVTASSRLSRLGLSAPLAQTVDRVHLDETPDHYWPLTENSEPALDLGTDPAPMTRTRSTVTFGAGVDDPTFDLDGRPAVHLVGKAVGNDTEATLQADLPTAISIPSAVQGAVTLALFAKCTNPNDPAVSVSGARLAMLYDSANGPTTLTGRSLQLTLTDGNYWDSASGYGRTWPTSLEEDGSVHHLAMTVYSDGLGNVTTAAYFDGALVGTNVTAANGISFDRLQLTAPGFSALVGRVGVWYVDLTAAEIADLAISGLNGFSGDSTDERIQRVAAWSRIPLTEVTTTPSPIELAGIPTEPSQPGPLMREVETAEAGVLYDDRNGNLVLKPRTARYHLSPALTVAFTADLVKNYVPKVDRQGLANVGTGKGPDGNEVGYQNAASRDDYGDADYSVETTALDPDEPFQLVAWRINGNAQPRPRVSAPEFSVIDFIGGSVASLLGLDVGSKLRLTNAPSQAPNATTADYFVEGYSEAMGVGTWTISPNLTPVTLEDSVLILDDATEGLLDTGVVAL